MVDKSKIDLACGDNKKEGFFGIDMVDIEGVDLVHDLNVYPWPIEDNSIEEVNVSHYIEHIPHVDYITEIKEILEKSTSFDEFKDNFLKLDRPQDGVIKFIDEIYRILKPGGKVHIVAPYVTHVRAYGDPTHTRYIHDMSYYYFNKEWRDQNNLDHYNIKSDFEINFSYLIDNELNLKSAEVRQKSFREDWNGIMDLIVDMVKK